MKLEAVCIKQFRSIEEVSLEDIGELNVLIGKNNSGKSNILFSIDSFFACIKGGGLVTANPPVGSDIDYFGKRVEEPIEFELSFSMSAADRDELLKDIVTDAPQMKNAAEGISAALQLAISIKTIKTPRRAAFVNDISLKPREEESSKKVNLLFVPSEAAVELVGKSVGSNRAKNQAISLEQFIHSIDRDDWERLSTRYREGSMPLRMLLPRRIDIDGETSDKLDSILRRADSFNDFRNSVETMIANAKLSE